MALTRDEVLSDQQRDVVIFEARVTEFDMQPLSPAAVGSVCTLQQF
jgi:hypothetical protein